eukprot:9493703-Prorocentrum_lima.AAC.1
MYAKNASELAVCNAAPVISVLLGDVGADCRSKSTGAAACHLYCSMQKIGQAGVGGAAMRVCVGSSEGQVGGGRCRCVFDDACVDRVQGQ